MDFPDSPDLISGNRWVEVCLCTATEVSRKSGRKPGRGNVCVRWECPEVNLREGSALDSFPYTRKVLYGPVHTAGDFWGGASLYFFFSSAMGFLGMTAFFVIVSQCFPLTLK